MSSVLQSNLQTLKTAIFETYGMTETVSHIAVKHLNKLTDRELKDIGLTRGEIDRMIWFKEDKQDRGTKE